MLIFLRTNSARSDPRYVKMIMKNEFPCGNGHCQSLSLFVGSDLGLLQLFKGSRVGDINSLHIQEKPYEVSLINL